MSEKRLDFLKIFRPLTSWPDQSPQFCWEQWLLTEPGKVQGKLAIDLSGNCSFESALKFCHPKLGLGEIARIYSASLQLDLKIAFEPLCEKYSLRWSENLKLSLENILNLPDDLQDWISSKAFSVKDLAPLRALPNNNCIEPMLYKCIELRMSRSSASKAIELATELILMDISSSQILENSASEPKWLLHLKEIRYPNTTQSDRRQQESLETLPIPHETKLEWLRVGDKRSLKIEIIAHSANDLSRKLNGLNSLNNKDELGAKLWSL